MDFTTGVDLLKICESQGISIAEAMKRREVTVMSGNRDEMVQQMELNLKVMEESILRGMETERSESGLSGGDAEKLLRYSKGDTIAGGAFCEAVAASMAVVEWNAAMGRIVAAPTAGASGILPGVLISVGKQKNISEEKLVDALFTAAGVGMLIALNATVAGADGGCQAETGTGASMAAAALVELMGGTPKMALDAAAMALKNVMGLVCDPVHGLVECPCVKRNAIGAANAMLCADMALSGITSVIPFDEVVTTMASVGRALPSELRETALGGLAVTPTALGNAD
ncbi:MAG: L-serine ammonia-lyase, iron-sulfur-dependent, subunit alpha [Clostridiales bacterium]|nr:L-serine ammonia-lyase, iron-sulfur-dependent, subunit alpha [Clostridiales bacterium]